MDRTLAAALPTPVLVLAMLKRLSYTVSYLMVHTAIMHMQNNPSKPSTSKPRLCVMCAALYNRQWVLNICWRLGDSIFFRTPTYDIVNRDPRGGKRHLTGFLFETYLENYLIIRNTLSIMFLSARLLAYYLMKKLLHPLHTQHLQSSPDTSGMQ